VLGYEGEIVHGVPGMDQGEGGVRQEKNHGFSTIASMAQAAAAAISTMPEMVPMEGPVMVTRG